MHVTHATSWKDHSPVESKIEIFPQEDQSRPSSTLWSTWLARISWFVVRRSCRRSLDSRDRIIGRKRNSGDIVLAKNSGAGPGRKVGKRQRSNRGRYSAAAERSRYTIAGLIARTGTRNKGTGECSSQARGNSGSR